MDEEYLKMGGVPEGGGGRTVLTNVPAPNSEQMATCNFSLIIQITNYFNEALQPQFWVNIVLLPYL